MKNRFIHVVYENQRVKNAFVKGVKTYAYRLL